MATNTDRSAMPSGLDAQLLALPRDGQVRGMDGPSGVTPPLKDKVAPTEDPSLGTLMDAPDDEAFKAIEALVVRQEPLAISRLHQDRHWTNIKLGRVYSTLEKVEGTSQYKQSFPPGMEESGLRSAAVPNKAADLANKLTETLLVDLPKPNPQAENDSEKAERGARMLKEFLTQDGTEAGTNDGEVFWAQIEGATARSSTFNHYWVDPTGGGSIAKQLKAHPQATDPEHPLDAVDQATGQPIPTTDYILRYVTADGQFTDDPSAADRQWLPKIKIDKLGREHVRLYPEDQDLHGCQSAIVLHYCTLGEARRRWPTVAEMDEQKQGMLCDWLPRRYLALLPLSLRSRWIKDSGKANDPKGSSRDERILFHYTLYRKADPDYPKGAAICVNGAMGGVVIGRDTLTADVEIPSQDQQDETVTDTRHLDIPLVQIRLLQDPEEKDAMGKAFLARVAGAGDATSQLIGAYLEAMDTILHPARFATSTSPLDHDAVEESRGTGQFAMVMGAEDFPKYEEPRPLPPNFLNMVDWLYSQADSSAGLNKPAQGNDQSQEVSGVARRIAVDQSLVSVSRMQQAANHAWERHWRVKAEQAMKHFGTAQLLRYVGEDGASKQEWFTGNDFSMVGGITVLAGTGTMMPPQEKVNYAAQLRQLGILGDDDMQDAIRPAYTSALGVPENPHQQRIERQVSSWLEGPPEGWVEQYQAYVQQKQAYDAEQTRIKQEQAQAQQQQAVKAQQQQVAQQRQAEDETHQRGLQAEQQKAQVQQQTQAAAHRQQMQMAQEKHSQGLQMEQEKHQMEMGEL